MKINAFIIITLCITSCVSNRVFNDLESRYARVKDNFNRQTKSIENLNAEIKGLREKFVAIEQNLEETEDSLNQKQQKIEQLESSLDLLKLNSETRLNERIKENEVLMQKIAERENELSDRIARVDELEGLITSQKEAMRNLKEKLSDALLNFEDKGLTVEARDGKVYVSMENKLLFKSGSWTVGAEGRTAIEELGNVLSDNPDISILIEGHTDNVPISTIQFPSNWELSALRAVNVAHIFEDSGMPRDRIAATAYADTKPKKPNTDEAGINIPENQAENRRVVVFVSELDEEVE